MPGRRSCKTWRLKPGFLVADMQIKACRDFQLSKGWKPFRLETLIMLAKNVLFFVHISPAANPYVLNSLWQKCDHSPLDIARDEPIPGKQLFRTITTISGYFEINIPLLRQMFE